MRRRICREEKSGKKKLCMKERRQEEEGSMREKREERKNSNIEEENRTEACLRKMVCWERQKERGTVIYEGGNGEEGVSF